MIIILRELLTCWQLYVNLQAKCESNKKYSEKEREDEANKWYNTHTDTHTEANVMNIYESVRTTPKCKTRAKSQNIPTHTRRGRREKE